MSAAVVFSVEISDEARSSRAVRDAALPASLATSVHPPQNSCIWLARPTSVGSGNKPSSRDKRLARKIGEGARTLFAHGAGGEQSVVPAGDADDVDAVRGVPGRRRSRCSAPRRLAARRAGGGSRASPRWPRCGRSGRARGAAPATRTGRCSVRRSWSRPIDRCAGRRGSRWTPARPGRTRRSTPHRRARRRGRGPWRHLGERDPGCRAMRRPPGAAAR